MLLIFYLTNIKCVSEQFRIFHLVEYTHLKFFLKNYYALNKY